MSGLAKRPLCPQCRDTAGWIYTETETDSIVTPCPCRNSTTPEGERDAGLAAAAGSNPQAMKAALLIIRETALSLPVFSSNDTRGRMKIAQVPPEVIGAAFRQAAKDRVIRRTGYLSSTDLGTKMHPVAEWESLIFRTFGRSETA